MLKNLQKIIQKKVYDILSHKYGIFTVIAAAVILIVAALHFGETVIEWSHEKYAAVFNSFSDNVAEKSFRTRLCQPLPIDVVYTWVNGTDPRLIAELRAFKMGMEKKLNISKKEKCVFANCMATNMIVLDPALVSGKTLEDLHTAKPEFKKAESMFNVMSPTDSKLNFTVVEFKSPEPVLSLSNQTLYLNEFNYTMRRAYYTSDWTVHNSILMKQTIIMAGFPQKYSADELKEKLPEKSREGIQKIDLYQDSGLAILHVPDKKAFDLLLTIGNISIDGKQPTLNAANLIWDLRDFSRDDDISSSRFEDNEELRYSLRSIERFAPWVRHVFIVTNGQIPHWLNLEYPRVSIVTHEEIFQNKSHLPTFSSPAIEANIHRIPGLSKKFIYMNDDVMFGKEVWPDDFFSQSTGQRVYLTWPVPNCQEGCPSTWIKDGYCDKACNNSECEFDGGDCEGQNANPGVGHWAGYGYQSEPENKYCNKGCATSWLADRYCDTTCNVHNCGYDVGDCGVNKFSDLYQIPVYWNTTHYFMPKGETIAFFNITNLVGEKGKLESASYNKSDVVRSASVANKFKVITVLLYGEHNKTVVHFYLKGHQGNESETFSFNFTLAIDTKQRKFETIKEKIANKTLTLNRTTTEKPYVYDIPSHKRGPKKHGSMRIPNLPPSLNLTTIKLPDFLHEELNILIQQYNNDELTEKGFKVKQGLIWEKYQKHMDSRNSNAFQKRSLLSITNTQGIQSIQIPLISPGENLDDVIRSGSNGEGENELPWERLNVFKNILQEKERQEHLQQYSVLGYRNRKLLDTFGDSLRHVNRLFNKAFGYSARKVPGHMPHMVDRDIMQELHDRFPKEWDVTSSNKIRSGNDMQFAFSYFYFLIGVAKNVTVQEVFDEMDTDKSGVLSDREIRTLATRMHDLPLDLKTLTSLEQIFVNCSKNPNITLEVVDTAKTEEYYEKEMPQLTKSLFTQCEGVKEVILKKFSPVQKYRYTTHEDEEIAFKMIKTNASSVVGQLDDIRKNPKKFICLNDNIDHESDEAKNVKAIIHDFYEAVFPLPSKFELPREYRNRFIHTDELREWKAYRDWLKFWTHLAIVILILFSITSYFYEQIEACYKKYSHRRHPSPSNNVKSRLITV